MEEGAKRAHITGMGREATSSKTIVRLTNGEEVEVRGYGALQGQLKLEPGLDLTKPIYEQVISKPSEKVRRVDR